MPLAIATGMSPYKGYDDARYVVDGYEPKNYGGGFSGSVDLKRALSSSINIVAVKLLVDVGFDPVIALAHRMGIASDLLPAYSLALGSSEVNLLELTSAYGTFAAEGKHITPHGITRITDGQGDVVYEFEEKPRQAVDKDTGLDYDLDARRRCTGWFGQQRRHFRQTGRWQNRNLREKQRSLVHWLHPAARHRRLDG